MKRILLSAFVFCLTVSAYSQNKTEPTPQWRPSYHFSAPTNWINDPNGLIYVNGVYHLYFQHNPFENKWGHMSWGHATSKDLIHWQNLPVAIPEVINGDTTTWIFSGSMVRDKDNTSGFCEDDNCLVAVYTADQPNQKKESQFIAYSNDGGLSFTNYKGNPVIDLNRHDFRDPNVFWHESTQKWVMAVALPASFKVRFYSSSDLKDWQMLSDFGPEGYATHVWECPFLVQLPVDGNKNKKKWVLFVSSGGPTGSPFMQYYIGDFDGKEFKNDNPSNKLLTLDHGDSFYAAIPWNDVPNQKSTYIGWMVPQDQQTYPWRGNMSIPRDLSLKTTKDGVRVYQEPASIISATTLKTFPKKTKFSGIKTLNNGEVVINEESTFRNNSNWIEAEIDLGSADIVGFKIAQQKGEQGQVVQETVVGYDLDKGQLYVDRSKSGSGKIAENKVIQTASLQPVNGKIKLQILVDNSTLEVFANNGEVVISTLIFPDKESNAIAVFANGGTAKVKKLTLYNLSEDQQPK
ncbi:glycoside hydrolase family 32 protein [Rufibacter roseus]|uniref:Glycoside hydrolase family 32 protein n=1 Tax=Rufibacter roseus TaxID=1567108 RepID=A0ABW2DH39_9BACT|nr:glycoside hydrolase family 32 protein [Rufibacter roseus]